MRGRGLKLISDTIYTATEVAPHAGAWIETSAGVRNMASAPVAPHAGAWIETQGTRSSSCALPSPPMRGRGLKPLNSPLFAIA